MGIAVQNAVAVHHACFVVLLPVAGHIFQTAQPSHPLPFRVRSLCGCCHSESSAYALAFTDVAVEKASAFTNIAVQKTGLHKHCHSECFSNMNIAIQNAQPLQTLLFKVPGL
jgi:hypothetical protein